MLLECINIMSVKKNINFLLYQYIGFVTLLSFVIMLLITPYGSGVTPDSTTYIAAAKSLLSGNGFAERGLTLTHYPPLYPVFLALMGFFENNLVQAARFLNAILFGVNVGLVALALYLNTGRNLLTTTYAVIFYLSSAPLFQLHSMAWSEPLFIMFSFTCILLLSEHAVRPTLLLFVASSVSLGFALVTRYIGIAFLPAALTIVFLGRYRRNELAHRLRSTLVWLMLACMPLGIFIIRNMMVAGSATNRIFVFHPISVSSFIIKFFISALYFVAPASVSAGVKSVLILLLTFLVVVVIALALNLILLKRNIRDVNGSLTETIRHIRSINWCFADMVMPASCFLFSVSYLLFLLVSISSFDALTPVDNRLLSPVFVVLLVAFFSAIWKISQNLKAPLLWSSFLFLIAFFIVVKIPNAFLYAIDIKRNGQGYTSLQWQNSEIVAFVKSLPEAMTIYSNGPDILKFLIDREALMIPVKTFANRMEVNYRYSEEMHSICKDVKDGRAVLVYLTEVNWRWYLPTQNEVKSACQMPALWRFVDGVIYARDPD